MHCSLLQNLTISRLALLFLFIFFFILFFTLFPIKQMNVFLRSVIAKRRLSGIPKPIA